MSMPFRRKGRDWFDFFPVAERLIESSSSSPSSPSSAEEPPLLVDIGGGQGEDLVKFHARLAALQKDSGALKPGRLILQDLPTVVAGARKKNLPSDIEVQEYDFFKEQPIRGARAYFMRTVLHDWPDKQAVLILNRVREAMTHQSVLLISETLIPESGVLLPSVISDMQMMGSFASLERTEEQWRSLLDKSGLELVRVWLPDGCDGSAKALAEQPALLEARVRMQ